MVCCNAIVFKVHQMSALWWHSGCVLWVHRQLGVSHGDNFVLFNQKWVNPRSSLFRFTYLQPLSLNGENRYSSLHGCVSDRTPRSRYFIFIFYFGESLCWCLLWLAGYRDLLRLNVNLALLFLPSHFFFPCPVCTVQENDASGHLDSVQVPQLLWAEAFPAESQSSCVDPAVLQKLQRGSPRGTGLTTSPQVSRWQSTPTSLCSHCLAVSRGWNTFFFVFSQGVIPDKEAGPGCS